MAVYLSAKILVVQFPTLSLPTTANDHGGGIFIEGSYIIFSRSNITNKAVLYSGAGLYVGERAHVIYASGTIRNNSVQKPHQIYKLFGEGSSQLYISIHTDW